MLLTRLRLMCGSLVGSNIGGASDLLYRYVLVFMLFCFLLLRIPYIFGIGGFSRFLVVVIMPLFLGLLCSRLERRISVFFSSFIPTGTPL